MRMWTVNPKLLCGKHLRGEHVEMHMFEGCIRLGKSIKGYLEKGFVDPKRIKSRHKELAQEMLDRGYQHNSPALNLEYEHLFGLYEIDVEANKTDLSNRCKECRERIKNG